MKSIKLKRSILTSETAREAFTQMRFPGVRWANLGVTQRLKITDPIPETENFIYLFDNLLHRHHIFT